MPLPDDLPGLGKKGSRPRLDPAALSSLALSPTDGFVLSRVDGRTTYAEICAISGLGAEATLESLRRLKAAGAILDDAPPTPAGGQGPTGAGRTLLERLDDGSPVAAEALAEGPGLSPEMKARILRVHRRLAALPPHELLGVPAGADAAAVRDAYRAASKELHPDRHFGKDLGPFREKLAAIFARLTDAADALDRARRK